MSPMVADRLHRDIVEQNWEAALFGTKTYSGSSNLSFTFD